MLGCVQEMPLDCVFQVWFTTGDNDNDNYVMFVTVVIVIVFVFITVTVVVVLRPETWIYEVSNGSILSQPKCASGQGLLPCTHRGIPQGMAIPIGIIKPLAQDTIIHCKDGCFALSSVSRVEPQWVEIIILHHCSLL
jgi:hypothetical protein